MMGLRILLGVGVIVAVFFAVKEITRRGQIAAKQKELVDADIEGKVIDLEKEVRAKRERNAAKLASEETTKPTETAN